jgi:hypothetical protein
LDSSRLDGGCCMLMISLCALLHRHPTTAARWIPKRPKSENSESNILVDTVWELIGQAKQI